MKKIISTKVSKLNLPKLYQTQKIKKKDSTLLMFGFTFVSGTGSDLALRASVVSELSTNRVVPIRPVSSLGFLNLLVVNENGSQSWVRMQAPVAGSMAGKVLTSNGTDLVWVSANTL